MLQNHPNYFQLTSPKKEINDGSASVPSPSQYSRPHSIEFLMHSQKQDRRHYQINQEGVQNRGRLFGKRTTLEANFFTQAKYTTREVIPSNEDVSESAIGEDKGIKFCVTSPSRRPEEEKGNILNDQEYSNEDSNSKAFYDTYLQPQYDSKGASVYRKQAENLTSMHLLNLGFNETEAQDDAKAKKSPNLKLSSGQFKYMKHISSSGNIKDSEPDRYIQSSFCDMVLQNQINSKQLASQNGVNLATRHHSNSNHIRLTQTQVNNDQGNFGQNQNIYKSYLVSLTYMKKFLKQLLLRIAYKDYRILQSEQISIMDDKSIVDPAYIENKYGFSEDEGKKSFDIISRRNNILLQAETKQEGRILVLLKKVSDFIYNQFYLFWMRSRALEPSSLIIIVWEIYFLLLLIGQLILIPIKGCFHSDFLDQDNYWSWMLYNIPIGCFVIDIIFGFHIGYYQFGMAVMDKKLIAIKYLSHKFWIDFSCTLLLSSNLLFKSSIIDFLAMFLRINQMKLKMEKIDQRFQISYRIPIWSQILKLIMMVVFLAHLCGCGFHFVGDYSGKFTTVIPNYTSPVNYRSWIHQQGLENQTWPTRYIFALYFSIISMVTIGYGDIAPINAYEKVYVIGITFITCGTFAYCLNTIGNIFAQEDQKSKAFQQNQYQLQSYLDYMQTPKDTQLRVLKYLEYLNEQSDEAILKGAQVFEKCSQDLKQEVITGSYKKLLLQVPLLRDNFSKEFLLECTLKMTEKRFGPGETLSQKGHKLESLMIITKGEVEYFYQQKSLKKPIHLIQNKVIDVKYFISNTPSELAVKAKSVTTVALISYKNFLECLHAFPLDHEKFCMIRDQILFDGREIEVCYTCKQFGHDVANCPLIHFSVQRQHYAKKIFFNVSQDDRKQTKRRSSRLNALTTQIHTRQSLKLLRLELIKSVFEEYAELNVDQELETIEKDKYFFKKCPKIRIKQLRHSVQESDNMLQTRYYYQKSSNCFETANSTLGKITKHNNFDYRPESSSQSSESQTDSSDGDEYEQQETGNNNNLSPTKISSLPEFKNQVELRAFHSFSRKKEDSVTFDNQLSGQVSLTIEEDFSTQQNQQQLQQSPSVYSLTSQQQQFQAQTQQGQQCQQIQLTSHLLLPKRSSILKQVNQISPKKSAESKSANKQYFDSPPPPLTNPNLSMKNIDSPYINSFEQNELNQQGLEYESLKKININGAELVKEENDRAIIYSLKAFYDFILTQFKVSHNQDHLQLNSKQDNFQNFIQFEEESKPKQTKHLPNRGSVCSLNRLSSFQEVMNLFSQFQNAQFTSRQSMTHKIKEATSLSRQGNSKMNFLLPKKSSFRSLTSMNETKSLASGGKQTSKEQSSSSAKSPRMGMILNHMYPQTMDSQKKQTIVLNDDIFGKLGLKFEATKEFTNFFPKFNYTNVLKAFKKSTQCTNTANLLKQKASVQLLKQREQTKASKVQKRK